MTTDKSKEAMRIVRDEAVKQCIMAAYVEIMAELRKLDPKAQHDGLRDGEFEPNPYDTWSHLLVKGESIKVDFNPRFKKTYPIDEFRGEMDIVVGDYRHQKRFPPRKSGVPHADIAAQIVICAERQINAKAETVAAQNKRREVDEFVHKANAAAGIKHKLGETESYHMNELIYLTRNDHNSVKLVIDYKVPAEKLVALLNYAKKELGI